MFGILKKSRNWKRKKMGRIGRRKWECGRWKKRSWDDERVRRLEKAGLSNYDIEQGLEAVR